MELLHLGQQLLIKKCRILRHAIINYVLGNQNPICSYFIVIEELKRGSTVRIDVMIRLIERSYMNR